MEELRGARVLVLGLGVSGISAAAFCAERGARVVAADERPADQLPPLPPQVEPWLGRPFPDPADFDWVVPSPGIAPERYRSRAARVRGDVELAGEALAVPIVAITGTNGKSTTATLCADLLRAAGYRVGLAGNVGTPALSLVGQALDVAVLEVSSFQLETTERFRPRVAAVLNLSPDHLDRHHTPGGLRRGQGPHPGQPGAGGLGCAECGRRLLRLLPRRRPGPGAALPRRSRSRRRRGPGRRGAGSAPGRRGAAPPLRVARARRPQPGRNAVAAAAIALAAGADLSRALTALPRFRPLPHRSQRVARWREVDFVDDSKATNPGAALRALEGQAGPWCGSPAGAPRDWTWPR